MPIFPPHIRAMFWMVIACISFAGLWVMIRLASEELHPFALVVWRNFLGLMWLMPMILLTPGLLKTDKLPGHMRRAASGVIATFATFYAVANAPLANVLAINYTAPLFATIGAVLFLGERVPWVRGAALALGFLGMLLVLRPGSGEMTPGLWAAVISAITTAFSYLAIKALTGQDDPRAVAVWSFILTTPVSFVLALPFWTGRRTICGRSCSGWRVRRGRAAGAQPGGFSLADAGAVLPFDFVRFGLISWRESCCSGSATTWRRSSAARSSWLHGDPGAAGAGAGAGAARAGPLKPPTFRDGRSALVRAKAAATYSTLREGTSMELKGLSAVVTGGASGLGARPRGRWRRKA